MYKYLYIIICMIFLSACENYFEFSPYQSTVKKIDENQLDKNKSKLEAINTDDISTFTFIAITDSHINYYELEKAIDKINSLNNIDFVIHLGDMTDRGWLKEFEIFSGYMKNLDVPFFTCIGNHDYRSNGDKIYNSMYGDFNYSMFYKKRKIIFFDATVWESNKQPNMDWFTKQLTEDNYPKIIFSHVPPSDEQFSPENTKIYKESISQSNIIVSMFGHHHSFKTGKLLDTNVDYIIQSSIEKRSLCKINIHSDNSYTMEQIKF